MPTTRSVRFSPRRVEVLTRKSQIEELRSYGLSLSAIHRLLTGRGEIDMPLRTFSFYASEIEPVAPNDKTDVNTDNRDQTKAVTTSQASKTVAQIREKHRHRTESVSRTESYTDRLKPISGMSSKTGSFTIPDAYGAEIANAKARQDKDEES